MVGGAAALYCKGVDATRERICNHLSHGVNSFPHEYTLSLLMDEVLLSRKLHNLISGSVLLEMAVTEDPLTY